MAWRSRCLRSSGLAGHGGGRAMGSSVADGPVRIRGPRSDAQKGVSWAGLAPRIVTAQETNTRPPRRPAADAEASTPSWTETGAWRGRKKGARSERSPRVSGASARFGAVRLFRGTWLMRPGMKLGVEHKGSET